MFLSFLLQDKDSQEGQIDRDKTPSEIRETPYKLPTGFEWSDIDIMNDKDVETFFLY